MTTFENINKILFAKMKNKAIKFQIFDCTTKHHSTILIDVCGGSKFDGMQIIFENGVFEVSEYMAGKNQHELHIYKETKSFLIALKDALKGNGRKPIKVIN